MNNNMMLNELVIQMSVALDAVEADLLGATTYHGKRVALLCLAIGSRLGYSQTELFTLAACGMLHDNALTEYILSERPGKDQPLNMKSHCILGERNIALLPLPDDSMGLVLHHHERPDGGGPFGLREGEFREGAGIIALADQLDVRHRLGSTQPEDLPLLRQSLEAERGRRYTETAADALLAVLDEALLERLSSENIQSALTETLPALSQPMTQDGTMQLAAMAARIIDYKSAFTCQHSIQIANKAWLLAEHYSFSRPRQAGLYLAAGLHDLGKLYVPTSVLEKPGRLDADEFGVIKAHAGYTWELLRNVGGLEQVSVWAANHHEKLDGSGYPFGKTAKELDLPSRLLACLDIYQAVCEARPYHPRRDHRETMDILRGMAGRGQLDAEVVDALECLARFDGRDVPGPCAAATSFTPGR